jgi:peptidyl-dipeptidase Dcp
MVSQNNDPIWQSNPLLKKSDQPHGAFPFNQLKIEHFLPALDAAIARAKENIAGLKSKPATFENTLLALETSGEDVGRTATIFFNLMSAETSEALQALAREISPKLASFGSDVSLDTDLFAKVKEVFDARAKLGLKGEDLRLTEKTYKDFARNGALLSAGDKEKLRAIDQEMAKLGPDFSEHVLKATNEFKMVLESPTDIEGLPESAVAAAAEAATAAGFPGKWLITLNAPSYIPFLTYSVRRDLREKIWRAVRSRAFRDKFNNEEIAKRVAVLRHQRALLLSYKTHADFVLEERMAQSPQTVQNFLERLVEKSKAAAIRDLKAVEALMKTESGDSPIMPWDYDYWAERLKIKLYKFDEEELRPYFKLENVVSGAFEHARRLYGLKFEEVKDVPTYNSDVRTFNVSDEASGKFVGLFYADFFPRPSKQGGAWMTSFRDQGFQSGEVLRPHIAIVCNFTKPLPDKPSLLSLDEVRTLFHEFGHSLHGLLSDCKYVSLGGTNVYWDFVELPSQIMENWVLEKEALDLFAAHYETAEKMPAELAGKIKETSRFQAGYFSMRQLAFSFLDMAWHTGDTSAVTDIEVFERNATAATQLFPHVDGVNSTVSFSHIFAGGYSAGYYSYKWAEVLDADAFELFLEKGLFDSTVAKSFRENILSRGGTEHPMELYKRFRGREPDPDALLRRQGLID